MIQQDCLVYGGSVEALAYAFRKGYPLLYANPAFPHRFRETGASQKDWFSLHFLLGTAGLLPFSGKVQAVRLDGTTLTVTTQNSKVFKIRFNELVVFDDDGLQGLPPPVGRTSDLYEVLDWINVRSGTSHSIEQIDMSHPYIEKVVFYPSERILGNHDNKDVCVISRFHSSQLQEFEFSEPVVRLKVLNIMQKHGIKGTGNGKGKHLSIKLESSHRQTIPLGKNKYEGVADNIHFKYDSHPVLYTSESSYVNRLVQHLK